VLDEGGESSTSTEKLIPDHFDGGRVPPPTFLDEIERRAQHADLAFFCVLHVTSNGMDISVLEQVLAEQMRADEGDIVASVEQGCALLLQGARKGQIRPFIDRLNGKLNERVANGDAAPDIEVLSHPADVERIMTLLRSARGNAS
ncbi:MAG: hypothetical protein ACKVIN_10240, partial [Longimicrobiales bacterium]